ncbi:MAG: SIS domain-containing protein, partial [Desulfosarcinaceae bacterium]
PLASDYGRPSLVEQVYLGGFEALGRLYEAVNQLKRESAFIHLLADARRQEILRGLSTQLDALCKREGKALQQLTGLLEPAVFEAADRSLEKLKDIAWCVQTEILGNLAKIKTLMSSVPEPWTPQAVGVFRKINVVLNSIDRLEVRGRDSAGISLLFILDAAAEENFNKAVAAQSLQEDLAQRANLDILANASISTHQDKENGQAGITFTYKVAAEIGSLGDNVHQLRDAIRRDAMLHMVIQLPHVYQTVSAHTRWASVGAINIPNCHPVDNATRETRCHKKGIIHACLNGDIDNYLDLRKQWARCGETVPEEISTDTKIIPLQIEKYLDQGHDVAEAFRLAVNDFEGSHAIAMHTDLAPGKFFLAQKGSGQAVFIGLADDHYLPTSEVYGFVEGTSAYLKLNGEKVVQGVSGPTQGQLFVIDQNSAGGLSGLRAVYYDGTPVELAPESVQHTAITSRDIDRQAFPHYFLKEISEAPASVARTLQNRWKISKDHPEQMQVVLSSTAFPPSLEQALKDDRIKRVFYIGQGTASIAAKVGADILDYYLQEPLVNISALKASELSGFRLDDQGANDSMADALVVAISQSGTTTDTNRAVDMVRSRGAKTLAIVNRRDSDITFKVDGVVYTSSGRDIEMSVASTKAFYAQIVAGALVALKIAEIRQKRSAAFISNEIQTLLGLPEQMRAVLELGEDIKASAHRLAPRKTYWAAVGSGPNKAAADEIRIKLSELCYKTISSDFVEDKKHIDLSSEPLILVCAAGSGGTVINDIIKDTAIFKAHKAAPVIIADEGEKRFDPYAEDVIHVPSIPSHLAPVLNTLAGHLWGYHAALAINEGSRFLHQFREDIHQLVDQYARDGLDIYEVVLEKSFREKIVLFYVDFRRRHTAGLLPTVLTHATDLFLLLKYLSGRLPVSDFELDFNQKGTARNMLDCLFEFLGRAINGLSRPVDAIKHQAKTVTVGTSRIREKIEGILFQALEEHAISTAQLINRNIIVLKNLQGVVARINGSILYKIAGLNLLGEPTDATTIDVVRKGGLLETLTSRVEKDKTLKGTKRIIVQQGNVYIGKGRKDDRSILLIPAISSDPSAPNRIEHLLLLNIDFQNTVALPAKIKALGGKYEHIKNIVQENSIAWDDVLLENVPTHELFGQSAEKIGESIVAGLK